MFPSPIGVIFSLINNFFTCATFKYSKFPSPIGVIFSLIQKVRIWIDNAKIFRFPSPIGVIFSLINLFDICSSLAEIEKVSVSYRSYILSYKDSSTKYHLAPLGFRLLSELYSLL